MAVKRRKGWLLPLMFLAGYLLAWGSILIDRQMVITEQAELRRELVRVRQELKLRKAMEDFESSWRETVIWNKEVKEE